MMVNAQITRNIPGGLLLSRARFRFFLVHQRYCDQKRKPNNPVQLLT
jgi:hypothetical protein